MSSVVVYLHKSESLGSCSLRIYCCSLQRYTQVFFVIPSSLIASGDLQASIVSRTNFHTKAILNQTPRRQRFKCPTYTWYVDRIGLVLRYLEPAIGGMKVQTLVAIGMSGPPVNFRLVIKHDISGVEINLHSLLERLVIKRTHNRRNFAPFLEASDLADWEAKSPSRQRCPRCIRYGRVGRFQPVCS
ncbi:unnamed protein product [Ectocarpus fasciculatus]